jgi:hypothetical protein
MPRTTDVHDEITDARLPEAADVVHDAAALHAAVDVRDAHTSAGDAPIRGFLRAREGPAAWLPRRPDHRHLVERARQEAEILEPPTARGPGIRGGIRHPLIVGTARVGLTQTEDHQRGIAQEHVVDRVVRLLAAIIARLRRWSLGALHAPFGPIVATRGEVGASAAVGGSDALSGSSGGRTMAVASTSVIPRRWASSVTDRVGASPSARRGARRTTRSTCIP